MLSEFQSIAAKLQADFERSASVHHRGIKGTAREQALSAQFLRDHLPEKFSVGSGEIMDSAGHVSKQQDLVVYDGFNMPVLQNYEASHVFFAEQVSAVIEVKSTLGHGEIKDLIEKADSIKTLERADGEIPIFGFAYSSSMTIEQIRDYAQSQVGQASRGWGVSAVALLKDRNGKTGLVTNVDRILSGSIKLIADRNDPIASIVTKSQGDTLLTFHLLLMEMLSKMERRNARPNYLTYAHAGGLGTIDVLVGKLGAPLLAHMAALKILNSAHTFMDEQIIKAWHDIIENTETVLGEPLITDGSRFIFEGRVIVGSPLAREVWEASKRYVQGGVKENDEAALQFLVTLSRRTAAEGSYYDIGIPEVS